jgi:hypothetical protein
VEAFDALAGSVPDQAPELTDGKTHGCGGCAESVEEGLLHLGSKNPVDSVGK